MRNSKDGKARQEPKRGSRLDVGSNLRPNRALPPPFGAVLTGVESSHGNLGNAGVARIIRIEKHQRCIRDIPADDGNCGGAGGAPDDNGGCKEDGEGRKKDEEPRTFPRRCISLRAKKEYFNNINADKGQCQEGGRGQKNQDRPGGEDGCYPRPQDTLRASPRISSPSWNT